MLRNVGRISELPLDPLTGNEYTYSVLENGQEFEVASIEEVTQFGFASN